jgi:5-methylcytosine-specific restriction endonuclease McrA
MNERRIPLEPGKRGRPWNVRDTRRLSSSERGYDHTWEESSKQYRKLHPLCVPCLLAGRVRPVVGRGKRGPLGCVDHIVPKHSCPELFWEVENWASMCWSCHGYKTRKEPHESWDPIRDRIVVCGLPGTGKTTWAKQSGLHYWDADERPMLESIDDIIRARDEWMNEQRGACVVIVTSIITASLLAARMRGVVKHMTERFVERESR